MCRFETLEGHLEGGGKVRPLKRHRCLLGGVILINIPTSSFQMFKFRDREGPESHQKVCESQWLRWGGLCRVGLFRKRMCLLGEVRPGYLGRH